VRQGSKRKGKLPQISAGRLAVPPPSYPKAGGSASSKSDASSTKEDDSGSDDSSKSDKKVKTQPGDSSKPGEEVISGEDDSDDENWETDDAGSQAGSAGDGTGPGEGEGGSKPSTPPVIPMHLAGGPGAPVMMNSGMMGGQESLSLDTLEDDNSVVLGLKVYTKVGCITSITGRLRV